MEELSITDFKVKDIRFPTSIHSDGSDAMHLDPDYSCAYVILKTENSNLCGHGLTFTIGRGTEVIVQAVKALQHIVLNQKLANIFVNFALFWRKLTSDTQLRWIGPEKGAIHMATGAIVNALWDLWCKIEGKPLWKLLVDMEPEKLVSVIDFRYITDLLTKEEAIEILRENRGSIHERELELREKGFPSYTTSVGWVGYTDKKRREMCREAMKDGYTRFKAKVGTSIEADKHRLKIIREEIGYENLLMVDANQVWNVDEAISWMKELVDFKPLWIEEPTSPDDILGHAKIAKELLPYNIGVATGEQCQNRVMFKQFLQAGALQYCQIDSCRLGGVNEILSIILMAAKMKVPVCPHAGGVGLCELVQHLSMFDFVALSGSMENRMTEYVTHLSEHFTYPALAKNGRYMPPTHPGYGCEIKKESMEIYEYPKGSYWAKKVTK